MPMWVCGGHSCAAGAHDLQMRQMESQVAAGEISTQKNSCAGIDRLWTYRLWTRALGLNLHCPHANRRGVPLLLQLTLGPPTRVHCPQKVINVD